MIPPIRTIQIKALLLLMIFTGNFLVICHCSADAAALATSRSMHGHCCCKERAHPCGNKSNCPGTQAVKFNLSEKQLAAAIGADPLFATLITRKFIVPAAADGTVRERKYQDQGFYKHPPPDLLAFFHRFLI